MLILGGLDQVKPLCSIMPVYYSLLQPYNPVEETNQNGFMCSLGISFRPDWNLVLGTLEEP